MQSKAQWNIPIEIGFSELSTATESIIIDCRTQDKYNESHLDGAINVPLQHLSIRADDLPCSTDDVIYVYCRTGNRSSTFATYLRSIGFRKCQSIKDGYESWGDPTNVA
jgi:rhodanese-related sulfurtransferase